MATKKKITYLNPSISPIKGTKVYPRMATLSPLPGNVTGNNISRLRQDTHISQAHLASMLGVCLGTVTAWETGRNVPPIYRVHQIAKAFNVDAKMIDQTTSTQTPPSIGRG